MKYAFRRFLVIGLVVLLVALAGCRQSAQPTPTPTVQINLTVEPSEPMVGESTLIIKLTDGSGAPINDATIAVKGDMNHAGMVPVLGEGGPGQNGEYRVPFAWTMAGDWIVTVTVTLADGTTNSQTFNLTVSGQMNMPPATEESQ